MTIEYFPTATGSDKKSIELPTPERLDITYTRAEIEKAQRCGALHVGTIDITNETGEIARYHIEIKVDPYKSGVTGCRITAMVGKKKTKDRIGKWVRASYINFKARLAALTR